MIPRAIAPKLLQALSDTPVVLLHGARQTGKTTLARSMEKEQGRQYVTLDDASTLAAAVADAEGFLRGFEGPLTIDEVQRAPGLFLALKATVDRDRRPGRFLLTGSADVLVLPTLAESLAGRMEILTLWPLAQRELEEAPGTFVDRVFGERAIGTARRAVGNPLPEIIARGGFPEARQRADGERRDAWFRSYITTILERDAQEVTRVEDRSALPRLLQLLATRVGGLLNYSDLSRSLSIPASTLKRYFALLEATFLVSPLPAWSSNLGLRLSKSSKLFLSDTGLAAHLLGMTPDRLRTERLLLGPLAEQLVVNELTKQAGWSGVRPSLYHWRTQAGAEVDLVMEDRLGRLVAVEVKTSSSISGDAFSGIRSLQGAVGERLHRGVVLYEGDQAVPFGSNLTALPISSLWS